MEMRLRRVCVGCFFVYGKGRQAPEQLVTKTLANAYIVDVCTTYTN